MSICNVFRSPTVRGLGLVVLSVWGCETRPTDGAGASPAASAQDSGPGGALGGHCPGTGGGNGSDGDGAGGTSADEVEVNVANPLPTPRPVETVAIRIVDLSKATPCLDAAKAVVTDGSGKPIESQLVDMDGDGKPDELVFQSAFGASERRSFVVRAGERRPPAPSDFRVYGRFVRERHDDFAWENDRIAHRMYGPDLETWQGEPLVSSGVDVWCKRVRKLVVNDWYMTDDYHRDNGEGADLYSVGKSRGCGGLGIWVDGKLYVSRNFVNSRVLANGPIRLVFELTYAPWNAGGRTVSETKRIILDAGKNFDRLESTFKSDSRQAPLSLGVGIAKHTGGVVQFDKASGWLRSWEPLKAPNGHLGCAIVAAPNAVADTKNTDTDSLMIVNGRTGDGNVYYAGFGWDRSGDFADVSDFFKMVDAFARDLAAPVRISLAAKVADSSAGASRVPETTDTENRKWAARVCDQLISRHPILTETWSYDAGLVLKGCLQVWAATKERRYLDYVKETVDRLIDADGNIRGYKLEDYNLDNINMGKVLFPLLVESNDAHDKERTKRALAQLRSQLGTQPRTADGGFWHKLIYPRQMWLDGIYMASPFLAEFAHVFGEPALLDDAAAQVLLAEKHLRDPKSGLLFHGWDETKKQPWANSKTGTSPSFWGRAMGWYAMAVVDVLEQMPKSHPKRDALLAVLRRLGAAIASVQDKTSGVWWQVLDAPLRGKNYEEASASSMFVYALTKAVRNGWLDANSYDPVVARGYQGIVAKFVAVAANGQIVLNDICKVAGLGGNPYRDGSFEYYTNTEIAPNDPKGVGAFILASVVQDK